MDFMGKRDGSDDHPLYGLGFRFGTVIQFYSRSLYWLVQHIGLVNIRTEILDDGEPVIYGEMTCDEFVNLVSEERLRCIRWYSWGVSWPYRGQNEGADDDFSDFADWWEHILAEAHQACYCLRESLDVLLN